MARIVVYTLVTVGLAAAAIGGWRYYTQTQLVRVEVQPAPAPVPASPAAVPRPVPPHGNFKDRFQPTLPPPDGGRGN